MVQQQFVTRCNQGSFDRDAGRPSTPRSRDHFRGAFVCEHLANSVERHSAYAVPSSWVSVAAFGKACRRLCAEKIWRSRSSRDDLHGLRLFREGIDYHFIFKHHQSFPQIYAGNPVLKPRVKLLPVSLSPCSLIVRTAPVSDARIYRVTPIARVERLEGEAREPREAR